MEADTDRDGKISFEEFTKMVENTDISMSMTLGMFLSYRSHARALLQPTFDELLHTASWTMIINLAKLADHFYRSILIDIRSEY